MERRKQSVWRLTLFLFTALLVCTVVSQWVSDTLLPQVVVYSLEPGTVGGEEYPAVVPLACVYTDRDGTYVFRLKQVNGREKVERGTVLVLAQDDRFAAVHTLVGGETRIAGFPSRPLADGETVKVMK